MADPWTGRRRYRRVKMCRGLRLLLGCTVVLVVFGVVSPMLGTGLAAPAGNPPIPNQLDVSPPEQTPKLVFIHASVGDQWLGHWLGEELGDNNYFVSDYNTHNHPDNPGHEYCDWWTVFNDPDWRDLFFSHNAAEANYTRPMADPGGENDIIMIKPCFSQYPIYGNADDPPSGQSGCPYINDPEYGWQYDTVGNVKQVLVDLLGVFEQHPDKFFVLVTAPPVKHDRWLNDTVTNGDNARAMANWMVNDWLDNYEVGNVFVFDLFNVLTSNAIHSGVAPETVGCTQEDWPADHTTECQDWSRYPEYPECGSDVLLNAGNHHRIWNGQVQHQIQFNQDYSGYCNNHPGKQATYMMTSEFVPLLNVYYNAWVGGAGECSPVDLDCNCVVDAADIQAIAGGWRCTFGEDCYQGRYDLNNNDVVDILDVMYVSSRWDCQCGDDCYTF
jgi:hypothetical protein